MPSIIAVAERETYNTVFRKSLVGCAPAGRARRAEYGFDSFSGVNVQCQPCWSSPKRMPPFGGKLSDVDIRAVVAYFKSLWPAEQRAFQWEVTLQDEMLPH